MPVRVVPAAGGTDCVVRSTGNTPRRACGEAVARSRAQKRKSLLGFAAIVFVNAAVFVSFR
eukprot:m.506379 g.506379  ORF g.506379 m.506379 type:complete len:61 (-) comp81557_c0_seq1:1025-1207(-)